MPEEITPGLYRLPIPLPNNSLGSVNVYAVVSADGLRLIDSGWMHCSAKNLTRRFAISKPFP